MLLHSDVEVEVRRPVEGTADRLGNPTYTLAQPEKVAGVLIAPASTSDFEADRPEGYRVDLTVHFPKTYTASLRGCFIDLPSPWPSRVRVIGDPQPYQPELTPGQWNRAADCVVADG